MSEVITLETHMSFVFLTERYAYKLKKPIRTELLDFRSVDARRMACEAELQLNRRLAADVYLAVVPVVLRAGLPHLQGQGPAIDWVVKMRRLPHERMLDACIKSGSVQGSDIASLAAVLTRFYATARPIDIDGPGYRTRLRSDIAGKRASLERPQYNLNRSDVEIASQALEQWLAANSALLDERAAMVRDAHGDLRPEHVCLVKPRPVVIDSLEFSKSLRSLDPVSELSFLAMECQRLGAGWIGERLFRDYFEASGDCAPSSLIRFYLGYHALIRAAIAVWHLDDDALEHTGKWRERGNWYLQRARHLS